MNVVAHNLVAMNTQRQFKVNNTQKNKDTEKLSSGYRINRAADDAAGLAISEKMRWQIRGLDKGETNSQDGISLMQIADGALTESIAMMHRLTELSIQAANDTNTQQDRFQIQQEVNQLLQEINHIADDTEFNTQKVFPRSPQRDAVEEKPAISDANVNIESASQFLNSRFGEGEHVLSADENGIKLGDQTLDWETMEFDPLEDELQDSTISLSFDRYGIKLDFSVNEGASGADVIKLLDGAHFDVDMSEGISVDISDSFVGSSQKYKAVNEYTWTFITDTANDYVARKIAYENGKDLSQRPLSISTRSPQAEFSIYPGQNRAWFSQGAVQVRFSLDQTALNGWLNSSERAHSLNDKDPSKVYAGEMIPVTYRHTDGDSVFSTKIECLSDVQANDLFNNTNPSDKFTLNVNGIHSRLDISPLTLADGTVTEESERAEKQWWIQTSSNQRDGMFIKTGAVDAPALGLGDLSVLTGSDAMEAIERVRGGLEVLTKEKGRIGSQQNRLEHTVNIDANSAENTQAAESRIRDEDVAKRVVSYVRDNLLENFGIGMMAQANSQNENVLALLS